MTIREGSDRGQTPNVGPQNYAGEYERPIMSVLIGIGFGESDPVSIDIAPPADLSEAYADLARRLYAKVDFAGPRMRPELSRCWQWRGAITGSRSVKHGQITCRRFYGSPQKVHRIAWELRYGAIPAGRQINHHCDNPLCVRLDHLYLGTQHQNLLDASRRGRFYVPRRTSVLTPAQREQIHALPARRGLSAELAARYGVTISCISAIRKGRFVRQQVSQGHARQSQLDGQHADVGGSGGDAGGVCARIHSQQSAPSTPRPVAFKR